MWLKSYHRDLYNNIGRAENGASMSTQWHIIFSILFLLPRFSLLPRQLIASLFLGH
jgi:hypothetical protein